MCKSGANVQQGSQTVVDNEATVTEAPENAQMSDLRTDPAGGPDQNVQSGSQTGGPDGTTKGR